MATSPLRRLGRYVQHGPSAGRSWIGRWVGFYLWWRTWALVAVTLLSIWIAFIRFVPPEPRPAWIWIVGTLGGIALNEVYDRDS